MTVKLMDRVIYLPRVPYGRQSELGAFVTRVIDVDRGVVDLVAFPSNSEPLQMSNVAPQGGNVQIHCWLPTAEDARLAAHEDRIGALEALITEPGEAKRGKSRKDDAAA